MFGLPIRSPCLTRKLAAPIELQNSICMPAACCIAEFAGASILVSGHFNRLAATLVSQHSSLVMIAARCCRLRARLLLLLLLL